MAQRLRTPDLHDLSYFSLFFIWWWGGGQVLSMLVNVEEADAAVPTLCTPHGVDDT